jgi:DNA-binding NarL/FixJ family response regulator
MVTTPALLGDLIKQLAKGRIDLDVIGEFGSRHALVRRLTTLRPDLVVIGLRRNESEAVIHRLLELVPTAKVVALSYSGRSPLGFELRLHRQDFADAYPGELFDFIRGCADSFNGSTA